MILTVTEGKTLLVDGPASIRQLSGKVSIWGAPIEAGDKLVVRKGRRLPIEVTSRAEIELTLGDSASYVEIEDDAIPPSWKDAVTRIMSSEDNKEIVVIGRTDSGKTSFCTYLTNKVLPEKHKVAIIDGDLGQSDIGSPGTIGLSLVQERIVDLFNLRPEDIKFVGVTSPSKRVDATLDALAMLKAKALGMNAGFLIINTDGWVEGDDAVNYKLRLVKTVGPDIVLAIESNNELHPILNALKDVKVLVIGSPKNVKKRDRETRKVLRESAYKKYLKGAKVRSYPLSWVKIEGDPEATIKNEKNLKKRIEGILGKEILHCWEKPSSILFVLEKERRLKEEELRKLELELGKRVIARKEGDESGLLVALEDSQGKFQGIGIICSIDFKKEVIRISTPVESVMAMIRVGQIRLDEEGILSR